LKRELRYQKKVRVKQGTVIQQHAETYHRYNRSKSLLDRLHINFVLGCVPATATESLAGYLQFILRMLATRGDILYGESSSNKFTRSLPTPDGGLLNSDQRWLLAKPELSRSRIARKLI
jgi:hypothetical protein